MSLEAVLIEESMIFKRLHKSFGTRYPSSMFVIAVLCGAAGISEQRGTTSTSTISTDEMVDVLTAQIVACNAVVFVVHVNEYSGFGTIETWRGRSHLRDDPTGFDSVETEQLAPEELRIRYFKLRQEFRLLRYGAVRQRIEKTILSACDSLSTSIGVSEVITSNGAQNRSVVRKDGSENVHISGPDISEPIHFVNYWTGWNIVGPGTTYASILSNGHWVSEPLLADHAVTVWRCVPIEHQPFIELQLEATRDESGLPRLSTVKHIVYQSDIDARINDVSTLKDHVVSRATVVFSNERLELESGVPSGAVVTSIYAIQSGVNGFWARAEIECLEGRRIAPTEEMFLETPSTPSAVIGDERLRIGYRLGSTTLNLDGRILTTHKPIDEEVSGRLEWWVSKGVLGVVPDPRLDTE